MLDDLGSGKDGNVGKCGTIVFRAMPGMNLTDSITWVYGGARFTCRGEDRSLGGSLEIDVEDERSYFAARLES